jgi:hypothetical protein
VLHWDGTAWRIVPSPNRLTTPGRGAIDSLSGVTAIAPDDVWAVGYTVSYDDPYRTLAMHWNGSTWTIADTPDPGSPYNALNDVTAVGPDDVWAVGGAPYLGTSPAPIESAGGYTLHWDGRAWAAVPPPADRANDSVRAGVAAVSSSQVWAVGQFDPWSWNGMEWTVPASGAQGSRDVDAAGSTSVWAVGSYVSYSEGTSYGPIPIGYRWTGSAWAQYPAAGFGTGQFLAVSVRAANDVLAVGYAGRSTLAARWSASGWQRVAAGNANQAPNTNRSDGNVLLGVDSAPSGAGWAVGYYYDGSGSGTDYGVQRTLVERLGC